MQHADAMLLSSVLQRVDKAALQYRQARWAEASTPGDLSTEEEEEDTAGKHLAHAFQRLLRKQLEVGLWV